MISVCGEVLKSLERKHPLYEKLSNALENVYEWDDNFVNINKKDIKKKKITSEDMLYPGLLVVTSSGGISFVK